MLQVPAQPAARTTKTIYHVLVPALKHRIPGRAPGD